MDWRGVKEAQQPTKGFYIDDGSVYDTEKTIDLVYSASDNNTKTFSFTINTLLHNSLERYRYAFTREKVFLTASVVVNQYIRIVSVYPSGEIDLNLNDIFDGYGHDFLDIINPDVLLVNLNNLDELEPGNYSFKIKLELKSITQTFNTGRPSGWGQPKENFYVDTPPIKYINLNIIIVEDDHVKVNPKQLEFIKRINEPAISVTKKPVTIDSDVAWQLTPNTHVSSDVLNGVNNGILSIGLSPLADDLTEGEYLFVNRVAKIDNPAIFDEFSVKLLVSASNGLSTIPTSLFFHTIKGIKVPQPIPVKVYTTGGGWQITSKPNWLDVSKDNGVSAETIFVSVIDSNDQQETTLTGSIVFTSGAETFNLSVSWRYDYFVVNPFVAGTIYFTDDIDSQTKEGYIYFKTTQDNTYAKINITLDVFDYTGKKSTINKSYHTYFNKGEGSFHLGTIVRQLMAEIDSPMNTGIDFNTTILKSQYLPADVSLNIQEVKFNTGEVIKQGVVPTFKMIKGAKPSFFGKETGVLSSSFDFVSKITPSSMLSLGFVGQHPMKVSILVDGFLKDEILMPVDSKNNIYNYHRPDIKDLATPGQTIAVEVETPEKKYIKEYFVFPESIESTIILFENEFGVYESFEATGGRKIEQNYSFKTNTLQVDGYIFDRNESILNKPIVTLNSGYVLFEEHIIIDKIIKSKNVFLLLDREKEKWIDVRCTTTKIVSEDTQDKLRDYELTFEINKKDDRIYP
jgi:hypothetical protein